MKFSILIPDGEVPLLPSVINCLSQVKDIKIYVISNKKRYPMRYSRHIHHYAYYPETNVELEWIDNINEELKKHDIDLVMPIFENGIKIIAKYKNQVSFKDKLCLLPSFDNFKLANDKGSLLYFLDNHHLPHPKGIVAKVGEIPKVESLQYPVLVKPVSGLGGGTGIYSFDNQSSLEDYFIKNRLECDTIVQERIEGYDIDCSVLCKDGVILAHTIQKATLKDGNPFAPTTGLIFVEEEELYLTIERLMKLLNWSGVAHVDLLFDKKDEKFKILEVNTRFWTSIDASLIAGVNFPYLYILASLGIDFNKPNYKYLEYLNIKGLLKTLQLNIKFLFETRFILNNTPVKFAVKDPIPFILKYVIFSKNMLVSKLKKS
ncbi:carboxylate--amine ligase [Confluentibacter citreus]|uniref:carboxylate--amine ligase n=1 Tax=Confluentibacter citreus TaxID=2007307 RepID=UPI000C28F3C9|nr:ATP-grasp domain-containing protein [Confluentibacter citreus]